jgi:hypothetical protein
MMLSCADSAWVARARPPIRHINLTCRQYRWAGRAHCMRAPPISSVGTSGRPLSRWRRTTRKGRARCINLGHCTPGCAQASVDITYWPQALRAGVKLRTRCRVREIATNEHGMVSGVIYYDPKGMERFQPAEVVILTANGIGTPHCC